MRGGLISGGEKWSEPVSKNDALKFWPSFLTYSGISIICIPCAPASRVDKTMVVNKAMNVNIIFFMIADFKCHSYGIVFIIKGYELRGIFQAPQPRCARKAAACQWAEAGFTAII